MKFHPTPLLGAYTIELDKRGDDRGFFARFFCQREFEAAGIPMSVVQINNSLSAKAGTLRGMHYQLPPVAEIKVGHWGQGVAWSADMRTLLLQAATEKELEIFRFDGQALVAAGRIAVGGSPAGIRTAR